MRPESRGSIRFDADVGSGAKHDLGAIKADGFDSEAHFALFGLLLWQILRIRDGYSLIGKHGISGRRHFDGDWPGLA